MHVVAAVLPDRVEVFDLVLALQVFAVARRADGTKLYEVRVCGDGDTTAMARGQLGFGLRPSWPSAALDAADTVLMPSGQPPYETEQWVLDRVCQAAERGARIASLCTGAFALAASPVHPAHPTAHRSVGAAAGAGVDRAQSRTPPGANRDRARSRNVGAQLAKTLPRPTRRHRPALAAARPTRPGRQLLEITELPIDQVAEAAGFGTAMTLRRHFTHEVGTAPRAYRNAFR